MERALQSIYPILHMQRIHPLAQDGNAVMALKKLMVFAHRSEFRQTLILMQSPEADGNAVADIERWTMPASPSMFQQTDT
jgi:hypothetical protein